MQEAITIVVFCIFSMLYLKEELKWNYLLGFALILLAVFFRFQKMGLTLHYRTKCQYIQKRRH